MKRYELLEWMANPVTREIIRELDATYSPELMLRMAHSSDDLWRAKGVREIINKLKEPESFIRTEKEVADGESISISIT